MTCWCVSVRALVSPAAGWAWPSTWTRSCPRRNRAAAADAAAVMGQPRLADASPSCLSAGLGSLVWRRRWHGVGGCATAIRPLRAAPGHGEWRVYDLTRVGVVGYRFVHGLGGRATGTRPLRAAPGHGEWRVYDLTGVVVVAALRPSP